MNEPPMISNTDRLIFAVDRLTEMLEKKLTPFTPRQEETSYKDEQERINGITDPTIRAREQKLLDDKQIMVKYPAKSEAKKPKRIEELSVKLDGKYTTDVAFSFFKEKINELIKDANRRNGYEE